MCLFLRTGGENSPGDAEFLAERSKEPLVQLQRRKAQPVGPSTAGSLWQLLLVEYQQKAANKERILYFISKNTWSI